MNVLCDCGDQTKRLLRVDGEGEGDEVRGEEASWW